MKSEYIASELKKLLTYGCGNHGCCIRDVTIGTNKSCRCIRDIYELSLELAVELEPIKNRVGIKWRPNEEIQ